MSRTQNKFNKGVLFTLYHILAIVQYAGNVEYKDRCHYPFLYQRKTLDFSESVVGDMVDLRFRAAEAVPFHKNRASFSGLQL